jgi:hypothetical protein
MNNVKIAKEFDEYELSANDSNLAHLEEENVNLLYSIFESLKLRDAVKVSNYFSDFASIFSMGDEIPPVIGRESILEYFRKVFSSSEVTEFELACSPVAFGDIVLVKQINHIEKDGILHNDLFVNAIYIVNGKINKWIAHGQKI